MKKCDKCGKIIKKHQGHQLLKGSDDKYYEFKVDLNQPSKITPINMPNGITYKIVELGSECRKSIKIKCG